MGDTDRLYFCVTLDGWKYQIDDRNFTFGCVFVFFDIFFKKKWFKKVDIWTLKIGRQGVVNPPPLLGK